MAVRLAEVFVEFSARTKKFQKGLGQASKGLNSFSKRLGSVSTEAKIAFAAIGAAGIAGLKIVTDAAGFQELQIKKLEVALRNAGDASDEAKQEQLDYAAALQKTTNFGDETIIGTQALIASFGATGEELKKATKVTLDFAAAQGIDLKAAAILVGKAFVGETGSLSRYGILVDENIPKTEKFEAVLGILNSRFGGAAKAERETFIGQLQSLQNLIGDFAEEIGAALIPILTSLFVSLQGVLQRFFDMSAETKRLIAISAAAALAFAALGAPLAAILILLPPLLSGFSAFLGILATLKISAFAASGALTALKVSSLALAGVFGVLALAAGVLVVAYFKLRSAVNEADKAQKEFAASTITVADRQKEGFEIAKKFVGVTREQITGMKDQKAVADELSRGIRGLATSLSVAQDAGSRSRIQGSIDALKALRDAALINAEEEVAAETLKSEAILELKEFETERKKELDQSVLDKQVENLLIARLNETETQAQRLIAEQQLADFRKQKGLEVLTFQQQLAARTTGLLTSQFGQLTANVVKGQQTATDALKTLTRTALDFILKSIVTQIAANIAFTIKSIALAKARASADAAASGAKLGIFGLILAGIAVAAFSALISRVAKFQEGGIVRGGGGIDSVPALLTPGEAVIPPGRLPALLGAGGGMEVNIFNPVVDSDERLEELADRVGEEILDKIMMRSQPT